MSVRSFAEGEVIYREGESCSHAFILLSGEVELKHNGHGRLVSSGDIFGELSLIQSGPHRETAVAKSAVSVQMLSEEQMEGLVYESPPAIQKIIMGIAKRPPLSNGHAAGHAVAAPKQEEAPAAPANGQGEP